MKWAVALLVAALLATVTTVVVVVLRERDPVPEDLRDCTKDAGGRRVDGADSLGPMRVDLLHGTLREAETVKLRNGYRVTFLRPADDSYVTIVEQGPDQFRLRPLATVRDQPSLFPLVAYAQGDDARELEACVDDLR
ncbi:MAG TPA: hypothetical protein VFR97_09815 [Capillimicrobium sp.]|nr:hypothetical protein [Capillimicrobium sp.]